MVDSRGHRLGTCYGCGAKVENLEGPGHAYLGTVPGCWALAGQLFAREYSDATYYKVHGLTVDAYSVQHQGEPERRTINSLCVHLIGLHMALEMGLPLELTRDAKKKMMARPPDFQWLTIDERPDWLTVVDVLSALDANEHADLVSAWARSVWAGWSPHHRIVREWAKPYLP